jgi:ABC-2 type transport system ATP-binding protein
MKTAIEARGLGYRYPGDRGIAEVSFDAGAGEIVCIFGWNGAGKTTLLKMLSTLVAPRSGTCRVTGSDMVRDREQVRARIFPVFDSSAHFNNLTGRENVRIILSLYGVPVTAAPDQIAGMFQLDLDQPAGEYSLGMRRKLLLVEAFSSQREILIFDEPTLGLDTGMCKVFFEQARLAAQAGACIIIGTNRIEDAGCADRIHLLNSGTLQPAASIESLVAGMIRITIMMDDRELVEYIPAIDDLPQLIKKILVLGIPKKIDIGGTGEEKSPWTDEAEEKIRRAPPFLQKMIRSLVERYAKEHGCRRITPELVDEVKGRFEQR